MGGLLAFRVIYFLMALSCAISGIWMLVSPIGWYHSFPAAIPDTGPLNPHFIRDIGVTFSIIAATLSWGASRRQPIWSLHFVLMSFFVGHALLHIADLITARLPPSHWLLDSVSVFLPAVVMITLALPPVWRAVTTTSWLIKTR